MSVTCFAIDHGVECTAEAIMTDPVPLCEEHQLQIALAVTSDVLTAAFRQAAAGQRSALLPTEERAAVIAGACPKPVRAYMSGPHGPVVYFADSGARIKIGFSTNLRNRIRSLSLQEKDIVLLLQGGLTLERALHDTFAKERIDSTEWFTKSDRLMTFIRSKQASLGQQQGKAQQPKRAVAPAPGAGSIPAKREDRVRIVRELIDGAGGDPTSLPLRTIEDRFGVHKATASRLRSDAARRDA